EPSTLDQLSAGDFLLRGRSTQELWQDRSRHRAAVLQATRSSDLELASRANWVLQRWQRGITPSTPSELWPALESSEPMTAIEILLGAERFSEALVAIEESLGTMESIAITTQLNRLITEKFPIYVRAASRGDHLESLIAIMDVVSQTRQQALCRFDLLQKIHGDVPKEQWLPKSAESWSVDQRIETRCLIHLVLGQVDQAISLAEQLEADRESTIEADSDQVIRPLSRAIHLIAGRGMAMAPHAARDARLLKRQLTDLQVESSDSAASKAPADQQRLIALQMARNWVDVLVATRIDAATIKPVESEMRNRSELRQEAIDALINMPSIPNVDTLRWRSLLLAGQPNAALSVLRKVDPTAAGALAIAMSQTELGFELTGFPYEQWDTSLYPRLEAVIETQNAYPQNLKRVSRLAPETRQLLTWMSHASKVGRDDLAWIVAERLCRDDVTAGVFKVQEHVLKRIVALTDREDWAIDLAMRPWQDEPTNMSLETLLSLCVIDDSRVIPALRRVVKLRFPEWTPKQQFALACHVAMASEKHRNEINEILIQLARRLEDGTLVTPIDRLRSRSLAMPSDRTWIELFQRNARDDLAERLRQRLISQDDSWALMTSVADRANEEPLAVQRARLGRLWSTATSKPITGKRSQSTVDVSLLIQATAMEADLAQSLGDDEGYQRAIDDLRWMACTPSTDHRKTIAEWLAQLNQIDDARQIYQSLLPITAINSQETQGLTDIATAYQRFISQQVAKKESSPEIWTREHDQDAAEVPPDAQLSESQVQKRREALRWWSLAFWGTLESVDYYPTAYVTMPVLLAHARLELATQLAADADRRSDASLRQVIEVTLDELSRVQPIDITIAETLLPRLRARGFKTLANKTMDQIFQHGRMHHEAFPHDAMIANNVAWGAAMNRRHLPEATELARRAVAIQPDSAIYRDTLAECLARMGNRDEAIRIEETCIIDDPGQWHLHQQIERFKSD
ncbi:MAG: hypothetical protein AAF539_09910, partial [Planctomycetota bacterium]